MKLFGKILLILLAVGAVLVAGFFLLGKKLGLVKSETSASAPAVVTESVNVQSVPLPVRPTKGVDTSTILIKGAKVTQEFATKPNLAGFKPGFTPMEMLDNAVKASQAAIKKTQDIKAGAANAAFGLYSPLKLNW